MQQARVVLAASFLVGKHFFNQQIEISNGITELGFFGGTEMLDAVIKALANDFVLVIDDLFSRRGQGDDKAAAVVDIRLFLNETVFHEFVDNGGHLLFGNLEDVADFCD